MKRSAIVTQAPGPMKGLEYVKRLDIGRQDRDNEGGRGRIRRRRLSSGERCPGTVQTATKRRVQAMIAATSRRGACAPARGPRGRGILEPARRPRGSRGP